MKPMKLWFPLFFSLWVTEAIKVISPEEAKKAWIHQAAIARTRGTTKDLNDVRQPRIVGGTNATTGRYPYFAYIELSNDKNLFFCSGTLIWPDLILTAAHCIVDLINEGIVINKVEAYVGLDDRTKRTAAEYREVDVLIPHPAFNSLSYENDLMIMVLNRTISTITPVRLNLNESLPVEGQAVETFGFGAISEDITIDLPVLLQHVALSVIPFSDCNDANSYDGDVIESKMICAGIPGGGKDACDGDSGSPLIISGFDAGSDVQVGLVSFGEGCGRVNFPGVYTRLATYATYILDQICLFSAEPPLECFATPVASPTFVPVPTTSGKVSGNSMGMGSMGSLSPAASPVAISSVPVGGTTGALPVSSMGGMGGMGVMGGMSGMSGMKSMGRAGVMWAMKALGTIALRKDARGRKVG